MIKLTKRKADVGVHYFKLQCWIFNFERASIGLCFKFWGKKHNISNSILYNCYYTFCYSYFL